LQGMGLITAGIVGQLTLYKQCESNVEGN